MISMIRFGLISACSMIILSCSPANSVNHMHYRDMMNNIAIIQYSDSMMEYSIDADSLISENDSLFLSDVKYIRQYIVLDADNMIQSSGVMRFYGNVHIMLEDSMEINTNYIEVLYDSDYVFTDDSVFINKENTRMITKGFTTDTDFGEIVFINKVIMYGKD